MNDFEDQLQQKNTDMEQQLQLVSDLDVEIKRLQVIYSIARLNIFLPLFPMKETKAWFVCRTCIRTLFLHKTLKIIEQKPKQTGDQGLEMSIWFDFSSPEPKAHR